MASGKLRREIGKKRPFGTLEEEAMLNLFRTSDQLQIRFSRLFREYGLTSSQYNVLRILRGEGKPLADPRGRRADGHGGARDHRAGRPARAGRLGPPRALPRRSPGHLRRHHRGGPGLLARLDGPVRELHKRLFSHMAKAELESLIRLLEKARRAKHGIAVDARPEPCSFFG